LRQRAIWNGDKIMSRSLLANLVIVAAFSSGIASGRIWTDSTGQYTTDANLVAFNDRMVILQRPDHELGALPIERLSEEDRAYLASKEAKETADKITGGIQTWTLRDGTQLLGRLVGFSLKDITLQRRRGKIYVNDRVFENLPEIYQLMLPQIVSHFERINNPTKAGLEDWLIRQKGFPRTFTIEGVTMEFENGDEFVVPFFFFAPKDLQLLQPGWQAWLIAHQGKKYDETQNESFLVESLAAARQSDEQIQRQIAQMQLNLQAAQTQLQTVQSGVLSLWEVTLYPARGTAGPPLWVGAYGRTSMDATNQALLQNPGYVAGPVRRVNRF
jgi:hypothetical protein